MAHRRPREEYVGQLPGPYRGKEGRIPMVVWRDDDSAMRGAASDRPLLRLDGRQETLLQRLADMSPQAAELYLGALWVVGQAPNGAAYLLAHAAREIENTLRPLLAPEEPGEAAGQTTERHSGGPTHAQQIAAALGVSCEDPVVAHWYGVAGQFPRLAHADRRLTGGPRALEEVLPVWEAYEEILYALLAPYYDVVPALDELLAVESPTRDHISKLNALLARSTSTRRRYFFSRLEHVSWLRPLTEANYFHHPPAPSSANDDASTSHPFWPESQYLVRVAKSEPQMVAQILLRILDDGHIENFSFLCDSIDAALEMPAHVAKEIASRARKWPGRLHFTLPQSLRKLVCKLASNGEVSMALKLTRCVLSVTPDRERIDRAKDAGREHRVLPPPLTRMDVHDYEEFLKEAFPVMTRAHCSATLRLACDLMEKTLQFQQYGDGPLQGRERNGNPDYSFVWRPRIPAQDGYGSLRDGLVTALHETALQIVQDKPSAARVVFDALEERPFPIFLRVGLHLLSLNPLADLERARQWLTAREVLGNTHYRREYHLLANAALPTLRTLVQSEVLGAIDLLVTEHELCLRSGATPQSDEDIEEALKCYRVHLMQLLADVLPPDAKRDYEALIAEVGAPTPLEDAFRIEVRCGSPSPLSQEQLAQLAPREAAEFLRVWTPPTNEVWGPEPEGLGRTLQAVVEQQAPTYACEAMAFADVDPTYVRHLFAGLSAAVTGGGQFSWQHVLGLCAWVLDQPDTAIRRSGVHAMDLDPDWGWTRKEIADLLGASMRRDAVPFELRDHVWGIVQRLAADQDPTPEREIKPDAMGPATLAINTVRGAAMHCVIHYALWCARSLRPHEPTFADELPFSAEIPEVLELLDDHLDARREPSAAIRSVYGQHLPRLMLIAPEWLQGRIDSIFPLDEDKHGLWWAAWTAFLGFNGPYGNLFPLLRGHYARALAFLNEPSGDDWIGADAHKHLAHHITLLYANARIALQDPLLNEFYSKAPAEIRGEVLEFVGRSLAEADPPLGADVISRFQRLLSARIDASREASGDTAAEELAEFGWCFQSAAFENHWSLSRLLTVLELTGGKIKPAHDVMERLAALAPDHIEQVVECARKMTSGSEQEWRMVGWRPHLRNILQVALRGSRGSARATAKEIIHELGERGCDDYRDLLS